MPHPQLIDGVAITSRDVGHHEVRAEDALVHWLVDHTRVHDFIRPNALHTRSFDGRLDEVLITHVQVEDLAGFEIDFLAETHDDEAGFLTHNVMVLVV